MKIVVDTSILIDYLRGGIIWERFVKEIDEGTELYLPTIVVFELFSGKSTREAEHEQEIVRLLRQFQKIELSEEIARQAGKLSRDIEKKLEAPDFIIAASALRIGATVVTLNKKHFEQIPNLSLYPL